MRLRTAPRSMSSAAAAKSGFCFRGWRRQIPTSTGLPTIYEPWWDNRSIQAYGNEFWACTDRQPRCTPCYLPSAPCTAKSAVMLFPSANFSVMGTVFPGDSVAAGDMHMVW